MSTTALTWTSAGTDNPGDQQASSRHHGGFYALGPNHPDGWNLTFVQPDTSINGTEEYNLGDFHTEAAAKDLAQKVEDTADTPPYTYDEAADCADACVNHAPDCDGYCDHGTKAGPHVNACLPDMSAPSRNENCIAGLRCPYCGAEDAFDIVVTCVVRMSDDGSDDPREIEWDETSAITCTDCGHADTVASFTITPVPA